MGCNCGGSSATASANAPQTWTIMLPNGTKVGSFPTKDHAEVARLSTYNGAGQTVLR